MPPVPPHRSPGGDDAREVPAAAVPTGVAESGQPLPGRSRGPQGLGPDGRLRRRRDYLRAYRAGRRRGGRFATLFFVPNDVGTARLGITASRKVGKSVVRQRLKRRVREIYRRWERRSDLPPLDLVVNLKPAANEGDFAELRRELERQLASVLPGAERQRSGGRPGTAPSEAARPQAERPAPRPPGGSAP
jgi:ribonuclease P protein component